MFCFVIVFARPWGQWSLALVTVLLSAGCVFSGVCFSSFSIFIYFFKICYDTNWSSETSCLRLLRWGNSGWLTICIYKYLWRTYIEGKREREGYCSRIKTNLVTLCCCWNFSKMPMWLCRNPIDLQNNAPEFLLKSSFSK